MTCQVLACWWSSSGVPIASFHQQHAHWRFSCPPSPITDEPRTDKMQLQMPLQNIEYHASQCCRAELMQAAKCLTSWGMICMYRCQITDTTGWTHSVQVQMFTADDTANHGVRCRDRSRIEARWPLVRHDFGAQHNTSLTEGIISNNCLLQRRQCKCRSALHSTHTYCSAFFAFDLTTPSASSVATMSM